MRYMTLDDRDKTWRFMCRDAPRGFHEDIDGLDCYWFRRSGGDRPTDAYTIQVIPVAKFWGRLP